MIRSCKAAEIFGDPRGPGLIAEYAAECVNALIGKPAPRLDIYENLEASGMGQCFAAYERYEMVGFAMVIVAVVPHYSLSCATLESLYVTRNATCGGDLLKALEDYAHSLGATGLFFTAPVKSRMARLFFLQEGDRYTLTNHVFCRRLA